MAPKASIQLIACEGGSVKHPAPSARAHNATSQTRALLMSLSSLCDGLATDQDWDACPTKFSRSRWNPGPRIHSDEIK
jgi:hypothetical protein